MTVYDIRKRWLDVRAEGAVGDGVTDDTAAINTAVASFGGNAAAKQFGVGRLLIQPGDYRISGTILFDAKRVLVEAEGARFIWNGNNSTPVVRIQNCHQTIIRGLRITNITPGNAGTKATAGFSFYNVTGINNSYNRLESIAVGAEENETLASGFVNGVIWEGNANQNCDSNVVDGYRIRYVDTGFYVSQSQNIDNAILNGHIVGTTTAFDLRADTRVANAEIATSSGQDFNVNAARVVADQVTSEQSARLLTITGSGALFHLKGGYWMAAAANIDAGGSFIFGVGNHTTQAVILEDWQLTEEGGYAGPTPIITLTASNGSGAADKALTLRHVRGTSGATINAATLAGCLSLGNSDKRSILGHAVYDGTGYQYFRNQFVGTAATIDFTRNDPPLPYLTNYVTGSDVTMTNADQYYDGPAVALTAGTWLLTGSVLLNPATACTMTAQLWDGTTAVSSGENQAGGGGQPRSIPVSGVVTVAAPTTYKISAAATTASCLIKRIPISDSGGLGNTSSYLIAVRIG